MVLRKVIEPIVTTAAHFKSDVKAFFGSSDDVSVRLDTSKTTNELVVLDEANGVEQLRLPIGSDVTDVLEAGGVQELVIANLLNFDPTAVIVDTRANQPAAGTADRVMVVTDEGVIERDTGSAWDEIGASKAALESGGASELSVQGLAGDLADRQDPKAHQARHHKGGADELEVVNLDASTGAEGQVPTVQSDGSLSYSATSASVSGTDQIIASMGG